MDLGSLREALKPLTDFGQEEYKFKVPTEGGEVEVALRPLLPTEETECQTRAFKVLEVAQKEGRVDEKTEIDRATATSYLDAFRAEVISYALVQIGSTSFRGIKKIKTGKYLPNGVEESVPLNTALRGIILDSWSRAMLSICFSKYGDLVTRIAKRADRVVQSSLNEIEAEIERTKKRLETLLAEREKRAKGDPGATLDHVKTLIDFGEQLEEELQQAVDVANEEAQLARDIKDLRKQAEQEDFASPEEEESPDEFLREEPPTPERRSLVPDEVPPPTSVPSQEERIREARKAVLDYSGGVDVSQAVPEGSLPGKDGKPIQAYRLPSETISQRGRGPGGRPSNIPVTDVDPRKGTENPNFKPIKR